MTTIAVLVLVGILFLVLFGSLAMAEGAKARHRAALQKRIAAGGDERLDADLVRTLEYSSEWTHVSDLHAFALSALGDRNAPLALATIAEYLRTHRRLPWGHGLRRDLAVLQARLEIAQCLQSAATGTADEKTQAKLVQLISTSFGYEPEEQAQIHRPLRECQHVAARDAVEALLKQLGTPPELIAERRSLGQAHEIDSNVIDDGPFETVMVPNPDVKRVESLRRLAAMLPR